MVPDEQLESLYVIQEGITDAERPPLGFDHHSRVQR